MQHRLRGEQVTYKVISWETLAIHVAEQLSYYFIVSYGSEHSLKVNPYKDNTIKWCLDQPSLS